MWKKLINKILKEVGLALIVKGIKRKKNKEEQPKVKKTTARRITTTVASYVKRFKRHYSAARIKRIEKLCEEMAEQQNIKPFKKKDGVAYPVKFITEVVAHEKRESRNK